MSDFCFFLVLVLKMLAVMEQTSSKNNENSTAAGGDASTSNGQVTDFLSTGRTGRRNALPDILSEHAHVTSSDLPARLQALTTKGMYAHSLLYYNLGQSPRSTYCNVLTY